MRFTPEIEMDQAEISRAIRAFDIFKEKGAYTDWGGVIYNFLYRNNAIPFSPEAKEIIKQTAVQSLVSEANKAQFLKTKTDGMLTAARVKSTDELVKKYKSNHEDVQGVIIGRAKQFALNKLFSDLQEQNIVISDWIESRNINDV